MEYALPSLKNTRVEAWNAPAFILCTWKASVHKIGQHEGPWRREESKETEGGVCEGEKRVRNEGVERFLGPSPSCFHFWDEESKAKQTNLQVLISYYFNMET